MKLTWEAVRERDRLLAEAPGLVEPIGFLFALHQGDHPGRALVGTGLVVYDLLARRGRHARLTREEFLLRAPHAGAPGLEGGFAYADATTDDARLVLRVLLRGGGRRRAGAELRPLRGAPPREGNGRRRGPARPRQRRGAGGAGHGRRERHRRVGRPPARRGGRPAPDPSPARKPPPLPGLALSGGAGGDVSPPASTAGRSSPTRGKVSRSSERPTSTTRRRSTRSRRSRRRKPPTSSRGRGRPSPRSRSRRGTRSRASRE